MKHVINTEQKLEQSQIKIRNRAMILNSFRTNETLQKVDLVKNLGLSITTVTTNINELLEEGLIKKTGIAESTGGRKPLVLELDKFARFSIGIDIATHRVSIIVMNLMSDVIDRMDYSTDEKLDVVLNAIQIKIKALMTTNHLDMNQCLGVGLSLPGIVDDASKLLINAPNIKARNYSMKQFSESLNLPLFLENEANVAAFAEIHVGTAMSHENVIFVSITDGIGCGIIIGSKVYKSHDKRAGEFGHMRISDQDIKCSCGRTGCWEVFASERALTRYYFELTQRKVTLNEFFSTLDTDKENALEKYYKYLSMGLENIILGLDPEQVIIGGEIINMFKSHHIDLIEKIELNSSISNLSTDIVVSEMTPFSSVIGASLLPIRELFGL